MISRAGKGGVAIRAIRGIPGVAMRLYDDRGRLSRFSSGTVLSLVCLPAGRYELRQGGSRTTIRLDAKGAVAETDLAGAIPGGRD